MADSAPSPATTSRNTKRDWTIFEKFQYDEEKDSPGDVRNALLVVAALIAAVTFQAGLSPPGGLWQETDKTLGHVAGTAVFASVRRGAFQSFLICNTLALSSSISMILCLTIKFPYRMEVIVACVGMLITYASAIDVITPGPQSLNFRISIAASYLAPPLLRWAISSKEDDD